MSNPTGNSTRAADTARRVFKGIVAGFAPLFLVGFFVVNPAENMTSGDLALAVVQRVLMLLFAAAVVTIAALFGMRILRLCGFARESRLSAYVTGAGLGLGFISLATLGVGVMGLVGRPYPVVLLGAMLLVGIPEARLIGDAVRRKDQRKARPFSIFELLLVFALLLAVVFNLVLAFNLPLDYDSCEYHAAAPARWMQLGRIGYIEGNVYSNFPMNAEMLHLFSMGLTGSVLMGLHLAVVLNSMTVVLAAGAAYSLARRFVSRRSALAVTALLISMPWMLHLTTICTYNEVLLAFFVILCVSAFIDFVESRRVRDAVLAAVFAGLAAGVKYTALAFFPPVLALAVIVAARHVPLAKRLVLGVLCVLVVVAVVSPWLVRNTVNTGNPVYPFFGSELGVGDRSGLLDTKFMSGQYKAARTAEAGSILVAMWDRFIAHAFTIHPTEKTSWRGVAVWHARSVAGVATVVLFVCGLLALGRKEARWLLAVVVLWTLFWYFVTHRMGRFWMPMMPVAMVLAGLGLDRLNRRWLVRVMLSVIVVGLACNLWVDQVLAREHFVSTYDLETGNDSFLGNRRMGHDQFPLIMFARTVKPERLMLVGEARSLYLPPSVLYSTVFDREIFTSTVGDISDVETVRTSLARAGVTHVFVNWAEVGRLRETYAFTDSDDRQHPGFPPMTPGDFRALVEAGVLKRLSEWCYGKPTGPLRGLTTEDLASLPDGKLFVFYEVVPLPGTVTVSSGVLRRVGDPSGW